MFPAEEKFKQIEGEVNKEFGFTDHTGTAHLAEVIKRREGGTNKVEFVAQIKDYEFAKWGPLRKDAVEHLEEEINKIGDRTPAQHKYGKRLSNALSGVDYHTKYIYKFFESAERDLATAREKFAKSERPHDLAGHGENAALNAAIIRIGEVFTKYVEEAKEKYADNVIKFVFRLDELLGYFRNEAIQKVTDALINPRNQHFSDQYDAQAYAHFIGERGIDGPHWHLSQFDKAVEEIKQAQLELAQRHEYPHRHDTYSTTKAANVWSFYKKQEQEEQVAK